MSSEVLVVGSIALDSVETPFGKIERGVGGAGTYAALAASLMSPVKLVGVIGEDFPKETLTMLTEHGIDLKGVECIPGGKSFHWAGKYHFDMNSRDTLATELNVFADFNPQLPEEYKDTPYVFLANIMPSLQLAVLDQIRNPKLVMCDTMNFWIEGAKDDLLKVLARVDLALMNDAEVRELTGTSNLVRASQEILDMGPKYVVVKKGEYGATLVSKQGHFSIPSVPLPDVVDPTGAGDSFAGGLIGFLAWLDSTDETVLRQALACGTVVASACVQDFSINGLENMQVDDMYCRYEDLRATTVFDMLPVV